MGWIVAYTFSGASLVPVTVTVAAWPGAGVAGLTPAEIVPVGGRNVIVWLIGVVTVVSLAANQMQNRAGPGDPQVNAVLMLNDPFTATP